MTLDTFRRLDDHNRRIRQLERTETDGGGGGGGDDQVLGYVFTQGTAATTWTINHPLPFPPNVTVVDSTGTQVEGDVVYIDADTLTVGFSAAFSGIAYLSERS